MNLIFHYPMWLIITDYFLGIIMWILILRFLLNIFFSEETGIKLIRYIFNFTNSLKKIFIKIIPDFIPSPLQSIYLCWIIFMFRFYLLPITQGWGKIGLISIPLENDIILFFDNLF